MTVLGQLVCNWRLGNEVGSETVDMEWREWDAYEGKVTIKDL